MTEEPIKPNPSPEQYAALQEELQKEELQRLIDNIKKAFLSGE